MTKKPVVNLQNIHRQMPPHNPETESRLLGAIIARPEMFQDMQTLISDPAYFHVWQHQQVWQAFINVSFKGNQPDLVMTYEELERMGVGDKIDAMFLANLQTGVVSFVNIEAWAGEIKRHKKKRDAIAAGLKLIEEGYNPAAEPEDMASHVQTTLDDMLEDRVRVRDQNPAIFIHDWLDYTEKLKDFSESQVKSPFYGLNALIGGLFPGEVIVLAGRPGMGKTALALNMVEYALKKGNTCGIFSLEMTRFALTNRLCTSGQLLGKARGMDAQKFRTGEFSEADWKHIYEFAATMKEQRLRVWDRSGVRPSELMAQARIWRREMKNLDLIIVDYLQLVEPEKRGASREQDVSSISRMFKKTALELEIPVLVLCQLSREAERSKKPLLSHLRESGAIEQDADGVWFLWPKDKGGKKKDEEDETEQEVAEVDLIVAKGRGNRVGTVPLYYVKKHLQFVNPHRE